MKDTILKVVLIISLALNCLQLSLTIPSVALTGSKINGVCDPKHKNTTRFILATYNIDRGSGVDGIRDIRRSARALKKVNADIIGLNELSGTLFYGLDNQAEQLGEMLGMCWLFAPTSRKWNQDHYANGLLSRFPVSRWEVHPLFASASKSKPFRNMIVATIPINDMDVHFIITHLDRRKIREQQLRYIFSVFEELPKPAVLLGDFNTSEDDEMLNKYIHRGKYQDSLSIALGKQVGRVDWIISKGLQIKSGGTEPKGISDHPMIWVEFELPK